MGGLLALLSAVGFTSHTVFTRKGLMGKNAGNIWEIRFVTSLMSLVVFLIGAYIASLYGIDITQEFRDLSFLALLLLVLQGGLGDFLGGLFLITAIAQIGASHASALRGGSNPLFATILAIIILGERPGVLGVLFVMMIVIGIVVVGLREHAGTVSLLEKSKVSGGVFALLGGFSLSLSHIARGSAINLGATPNTGYVIGLVTALVIFAVVSIVKTRNFNPFLHIDRKNVYYYAIASIGHIIGGYALFTAFTLIPVWQASAIRNVQPLMAILFTWLFLKEAEKVNLRLFVGALLVTLGVVFLNVYVQS